MTSTLRSLSQSGKSLESTSRKQCTQILHRELVTYRRRRSRGVSVSSSTLAVDGKGKNSRTDRPCAIPELEWPKQGVASQLSKICTAFHPSPNSIFLPNNCFLRFLKVRHVRRYIQLHVILYIVGRTLSTPLRNPPTKIYHTHRFHFVTLPHPNLHTCRSHDLR